MLMVVAGARATGCMDLRTRGQRADDLDAAQGESEASPLSCLRQSAASRMYFSSPRTSLSLAVHVWTRSSNEASGSLQPARALVTSPR